MAITERSHSEIRVVCGCHVIQSECIVALKKKPWSVWNHICTGMERKDTHRNCTSDADQGHWKIAWHVFYCFWCLRLGRTGRKMCLHRTSSIAARAFFSFKKRNKQTGGSSGVFKLRSQSDWRQRLDMCKSDFTIIRLIIWSTALHSSSKPCVTALACPEALCHSFYGSTSLFAQVNH